MNCRFECAAAGGGRANVVFAFRYVGKCFRYKILKSFALSPYCLHVGGVEMEAEAESVRQSEGFAAGEGGDAGGLFPGYRYQPEHLQEIEAGKDQRHAGHCGHHCRPPRRIAAGLLSAGTGTPQQIRTI